jgi:thioredoxin-like negative regulator of GroEL
MMRGMTLIYFVASWSEATCGPYRVVVGQAAERLGLGVREVDVDLDMDVAIDHRVMEVPAVTLEGEADSLNGAQSSAALEAWLQERLNLTQ